MTMKYIGGILGLLMIGSLIAETPALPSVLPIIEAGMPINVPTVWSEVGTNLYAAGSNIGVSAKELWNYVKNPLPASMGQVAVDTSKMLVDATAFLARHPVAIVIAGGLTAYFLVKLHKAYQRGWRGLSVATKTQRESSKQLPEKKQVVNTFPFLKNWVP